MRLLLAAALVCLSCAHVREDEMTASEHRNEAAIHTANAENERAKFDPKDRRAVGRPNGDPAQEWNARIYNPTQSHLDAADRELRAAAEHLRAARKLEAFEDARCQNVAPAERAACPLLASSVARVTELRAGVLLEMKPQADAVDTFRRLDCHLAWAVAEGFTRPSCPLFVKGMSLALVMDGKTRQLALTSDDAKVAEELRVQARRIFGGEPLVSSAP